jgi:hypothetical protein
LRPFSRVGQEEPVNIKALGYLGFEKKPEPPEMAF